MSAFSLADLLFILLICGLVYGLLQLAKRAKPGGDKGDKS